MMITRMAVNDEDHKMLMVEAKNDVVMIYDVIKLKALSKLRAFKKNRENTNKMKSGPLEKVEDSRDAITPTKGVNRGFSIVDFILRIVAAIGTLGSAVAMGTTDETLPFFTQFIQFRAQYDDLPSFMFFVIANSIVCAYLVLSLPLSIVHIIKSTAKSTRIILVIFDTAMLALVSAAASAAAAIVYLAHNGNTSANWFAICQQFNNFCERISGSLIGSFVAVVVLILIIITSTVALSRH